MGKGVTKEGVQIAGEKLREEPKGSRAFLPRRWIVERTFSWLGRNRRLSKDYERLPESAEAFIYVAMSRLMVRTGVELLIHVRSKDPYPPHMVSIDEALSMMDNWPGLFSPTGEPYRSLNRTLMNLPGGVPSGLVPYLRMVHLEKPVLSRSELVMLTLYEQWQFGREPTRHNEEVFRSAPEERIGRATRLIADHTRNPLSTRRTRDLKFVLGFLLDYPGEHRGNIVGLAQRSIRWHRQQQEQERERILERLGSDRSTELPPIPVPQDPGIRFLSSVREVCEEGMKMNNCVASYAHQATEGQCYIFHILHAGEEATVEVNRAGRVMQAAGPGNRVNAASRWGRRILGRWGEAFPEGYEQTGTPLAGMENPFEDFPEVPF